MTLRLLGRDFDGFRRAVDTHAAAWPGGSIEATWLGLPALQAAVLGERPGDAPGSGLGSGPGGADLLVVPADWLPALAAAGTIRALDRLPEHWPAAWSDSFVEGVTWSDRVWGLPFHDGPQLLFTRPDLAGGLAGGGVPGTWSELVAQAGLLHRPGVRSGTVQAGRPDGHNNVYDLVLHLWRCGGDLLDGDRVTLDSAAAREALTFLRGLVTTVLPADAHDLDSNDSGAEFAAGRVGLMVNWAGYAALAAAAGVSFACHLAPTHDDGTPTTTVNAFWATAVTTGCGDVDAALDYLAHATGAAMDAATTRAGASGARLSTWSDAELLLAHPEHALFAAAHASSRPLPRIPELPAVVDVLDELVDAVVWRGEPADPALASAQRAVERLVGSGVRA